MNFESHRLRSDPRHPEDYQLPYGLERELLEHDELRPYCPGFHFYDSNRCGGPKVVRSYKYDKIRGLHCRECLGDKVFEFQT